MNRLTFTTPPPGLGSGTDYDLHDVAGVDGLYNMQAAENPGLGLYLIDSGYVPGYVPAIPDESRSELGLQPGSDGRVLLVAQTGETITVNLMAPIVVNLERGLATQIILEGEDYPVRAELAAG